MRCDETLTCMRQQQVFIEFCCVCVHASEYVRMHTHGLKQISIEYALVRVCVRVCDRVFVCECVYALTHRG